MQGWRLTREGSFHLTSLSALSEGSDVIQIIKLHESAEYIQKMPITTNAQDKFKVLHDDPLLRSDPVLSKVAIVGQHKEVIYGLSHRFVNSEEIDHGKKRHMGRILQS